MLALARVSLDAKGSKRSGCYYYGVSTFFFRALLLLLNGLNRGHECWIFWRFGFGFGLYPIIDIQVTVGICVLGREVVWIFEL
jgi:hypothetical protein